MWKVSSAYIEDDVSNYVLINIEDENNCITVDHITFSKLYDMGKIV
jgi:hypothetical protein